MATHMNLRIGQHFLGLIVFFGKPVADPSFDAIQPRRAMASQPWQIRSARNSQGTVPGGLRGHWRHGC